MLSVTESGSDLTLLTWTGAGGTRPVGDEAEKAYESLTQASHQIAASLYQSSSAQPDAAAGGFRRGRSS